MGSHRPVRSKDKEILHILFHIVELVKKQIKLKQISGQDRIDALGGDGMGYGCAAFLELFFKTRLDEKNCDHNHGRNRGYGYPQNNEKNFCPQVQRGDGNGFSHFFFCSCLATHAFISRIESNVLSSTGTNCSIIILSSSSFPLGFVWAVIRMVRSFSLSAGSREGWTTNGGMG